MLCYSYPWLSHPSQKTSITRVGTALSHSLSYFGVRFRFFTVPTNLGAWNHQATFSARKGPAMERVLNAVPRLNYWNLKSRRWHPHTYRGSSLFSPSPHPHNPYSHGPPQGMWLWFSSLLLQLAYWCKGLLRMVTKQGGLLCFSILFL